MRSPNRTCLTLLTASLALVGCGETDKWTADRPKPVPAMGTVLLDQKPVEGATIVFQPDGGGHTRAATGVTDAAGEFRLQTYDPNDGAVPGKFKVTVTKVEVESTAASEESNVNDSSAPTSEWLIPKKYGNSATSGLKAEVTEGGENDFTFELKK
jgi:hypothetical protein